MPVHYVLLILASGCLLAFLVLWIFLQTFLAKYKPDSVIYWRQCPLAAKICFLCTNNMMVSLFISGLRIFVTTDLSIWQWIKILRYAPTLITIKFIFDDIDDKIDSTKPDDILLCGPACLGKEISPFLSNILQEQQVHVFNQLLEKNIMPRDELISFGNVLALRLYRQAILTLAFNDTQDACERANIRAEIAQENMGISGGYLALLVHIIKKDVRITQLLEMQESLTYEHIKAIYPHSTKAGELFQISHDMIGFRFDLKEEAKIQKISANYFLAQLQKQGVLQSPENKLYSLPVRAVGFYELPVDVHKVFVQVQCQFSDSAFQMGFLPGLILCLVWEYRWRVGFRG